VQRYLKKVMIVPQGDRIIDWIYSVDSLISAVNTYLPGMEYTIGVAKHTRSFSGGRLKLLHYLKQQGINHHGIHLLGIGEDLIELRELALTYGNFVRSIDSARPGIYTYAKHYCRLGDPLPAISRPEGYFDLDLDEGVKASSWHRLRSNISMYNWAVSEGVGLYEKPV
jgi:hypothetical protein